MEGVAEAVEAVEAKARVTRYLAWYARVIVTVRAIRRPSRVMATWLGGVSREPGGREHGCTGSSTRWQVRRVR